MNVSVCITTLNEQGSIARLLDSLLDQTQKPNEIMIVDGGSQDKTIDIIRHYQKKDQRIKLLVEKGSIAHGRNIGIEIARGEIIVLTDAGCLAKSDWLAKIIEPFKYANVGIVAGFYDLPAKKPLPQAISVFHAIPPERYDAQKFLPSNRSVAFRKQVWEEIGGFDENLERAAEDSKFYYQAVKKGVKIVRVKEARVVWQESVEFSLKDSVKKIFYYAKGDAQAGIWWHPSQQLSSHNIKISLVFVRYVLGLILFYYSVNNIVIFYFMVFIFFIYLFWSIWKWRDVIKNWEARLWLPIVQISSDLAVMAGFLSVLWPKKST